MNINIFGFVQCKYILSLLWLTLFTNNGYFGWGMIICSCITPTAQKSRNQHYLHAKASLAVVAV